MTNITIAGVRLGGGVAVSEAVIIVRFDEHGDIDYRVCGNVRLFIVDERCPHDRVYEWLPRCDASEIREIIPEGSEIGSNQDERHAAIEHAVLSFMEGKPHLRAVDDGPNSHAGERG